MRGRLGAVAVVLALVGGIGQGELTSAQYELTTLRCRSVTVAGKLPTGATVASVAVARKLPTDGDVAPPSTAPAALAAERLEVEAARLVERAMRNYADCGDLVPARRLRKALSYIEGAEYARAAWREATRQAAKAQ